MQPCMLKALTHKVYKAEALQERVRAKQKRPEVSIAFKSMEPARPVVKCESAVACDLYRDETNLHVSSCFTVLHLFRQFRLVQRVNPDPVSCSQNGECCGASRATSTTRYYQQCNS